VLLVSYRTVLNSSCNSGSLVASYCNWQDASNDLLLPRSETTVAPQSVSSLPPSCLPSSILFAILLPSCLRRPVYQNCTPLATAVPLDAAVAPVPGEFSCMRYQTSLTASFSTTPGPEPAKVHL
jgi:hypothetical protein